MKDLKERWELAQNYEFNWWKAKAKTIGVDYYKHSAEEIKSFYTQSKLLIQDISVLEIGSGATGILTFLTDSKERYAIDPLESYYSTVFGELRDKSVNYQTAKGESLPFENKKFDLIIIDNVLDHCEDPHKVMSEVNRVIKENGAIYFRQNTYSIYGKFMRSVMELFLIDKGHPYTFRKQELEKMLGLYKFNIMISERDGYLKTWWRELTSKSLKDKIKAMLFITRDKVTFFVVKC